MHELLMIALVMAVMAVPVLLAAELRHVLVSYFLNRSIQKALETAPEHVESLIARLASPPPSAVSPTGLGASIMGGAFLISLLFADAGIDSTDLAIGIGVTLFGSALLVTRWIAARNAARP